MKPCKPFLLFGWGVVFCLLLSACGGKTPPNGPAALNFRVATLADGAVSEPYKQVIVVTGGVLPYTYSLTGGALPPGLSMDSVGVVSGTPTTAGVFNFSVKVVDSQQPTQAYNNGSFTITINPSLALLAGSLPDAVIQVAYSTSITATGGVPITKDPSGNPLYAYAIISDPDCLFTNTTTSDPTQCPTNAGLTLASDGTGTISGTPTGPVHTYNFTAQVTDAGAATATQNYTINVVGKIQGHYSFSFNGFNNGQPFYLAGSFVADGSGNITSGIFDRNGTGSTDLMTQVAMTSGSGGNGIQCPLTGTGSVYCVDSNNLGRLAVVSTLGSYTFVISVSTMGETRMILSNAGYPAIYGSGVMKKQTLTVPSLANASFTLGFFGVDSGGDRYAGAGNFHTTDGTNIDAGTCGSVAGCIDTNDNGTASGGTAITGGSIGAPDPNTGRGIITLTTASATADYAYYIVTLSSLSGSELLAVQIDAVSGGAPVTVASILRQLSVSGGGGQFTNSSLSTNFSGDPSPPPTNADAFELNAITSGAPDISLGLAQFDGKGALKSYSFDENQGGTLTTPTQNTLTGTYSVDKTGRVTFPTGFGSTPPVWYLVTFNQGFVIGSDASVTAGTFEPQSIPPPYNTLAFFGNYYGGSISPVLSGVVNEVDSWHAVPGDMGTNPGTYTLSYFTSGPGGPHTPPQQAGTYSILDQNVARIEVTDSNKNLVDILYLVSAGGAGATSANTRVVGLNTDANPRLSVLGR
jgi:Putative Ig domain